MAWGEPKTNWGAADEPGASDANRWESNAKYNYDTNKAIAATGTGTNITLTTDSNIVLVDGLRLMFRAIANNNGGTTKVAVDGAAAKPLYKPGSTEAPNVKIGKAYVIWYQESGGCFYVQEADDYEEPLNAHINAANPHSGSASTDDVNTVQSSLGSHTGNTNNPHNVSKSQVGLGNTPNYTAEQTRTASSYKLRAEVKSSAPSSPVNGDIWYDTTEHKFKGRANGAWV